MSNGLLPHVIIIGGGFGGLSAARALRKAPVRVTLIDRTNHHLFQPLLYEVATAGLSGPDIAAPLRHILRKQANIAIRMETVTSIDVMRKCVIMGDDVMSYDYLIVATGSSHAYFGHDDWATDAPGMKTMNDALAIRRHILNAFEAAEREPDPARRAAWLSFVVIGAGPTGVELAGTLAEIAHHTLTNEFRVADPHHAQIHLVEAGPRVLASMPADLSAKAQQQLEQLQVRVHLNSAVTGVGDDHVQIGERRIHARTLVWAAGVAASALGRQLDTPCDRAGRVQVSPDLSLPQHPEVFVIGDLAHLEQDGKPVPALSPAAKQMGAHAATMIRQRLAGRPTRGFRYKDYGSFATIGRGKAVADLRGVHLSGVLAWWLWLVVHIFFLIGFGNRLLVTTGWAWSYLTWQRNARIIVGGESRR
jgi:NADH dehydrogenase